ncbi:MAG: helix-turn-helix domain-containing protein [Myxococcota bacterium]
MSKAAINAAIDLFHRRWVLRIIWELRSKPLTFRALRAACDEISPTVLNQRLAELREVRIVVHQDGAGYALSPHGERLLVAMAPMMEWASAWHEEVTGSGGTPRSSPEDDG